MIVVLLKAWIVNLIKRAVVRKVRKVMLGKFVTHGSIVALIVGLVSKVLGVEIATADVDKVVTAIAVIGVYAPQIVAALRAKFGKAE